MHAGMHAISAYNYDMNLRMDAWVDHATNSIAFSYCSSFKAQKCTQP